MSDYLSADVNDLPSINISVANPDNVVGQDFYPVNGVLNLHSTLRLFPKWTVDMLANRNNGIEVIGNKTSDMEMSSIILYCQLNGHDEAWRRYGDIALYDESLGWVQYWIQPEQLLEGGSLVLTPDQSIVDMRNSIDYSEATLFFQKTKFYSTMDFPWYFNSIKGTDKFEPGMVSDFYVKQSSSKFRVTHN